MAAVDCLVISSIIGRRKNTVEIEKERKKEIKKKERDIREPERNFDYVAARLLYCFELNVPQSVGRRKKEIEKEIERGKERER